MIELVLSVPDISCGHCVTGIESSVGQLAGIGTVQVDLSAKTVRVTGTPTAMLSGRRSPTPATKRPETL